MAKDRGEVEGTQRDVSALQELFLIEFLLRDCYTKNRGGALSYYYVASYCGVF